MDVLYAINGNEKTNGKSSMYMTIIIKMLWNGYMEMLQQFQLVSVVMWWRKFMCLLFHSSVLISYDIYINNKSITGNERTATYGLKTYSKEQEVGEQQKGKQQRVIEKTTNEKVQKKKDM